MDRPFAPEDDPPAADSTSPQADDASAGLFGYLARGGVPRQVSDRAWLQAMLDVEAAIARAEARAGAIPQDAADAIAASCRADMFDPSEIGRSAAEAGTPVPALVAALTAEVASTAGERAARYVHLGATSQDVMDTAAMLVVTRAAAPLRDDLAAAGRAAASLATRHRDTPMAARTLLQQALPTTFGALAASWLTGLDRAAIRLDGALNGSLAIQFGGAAGTLASLGDDGPQVLGHLAAELGLAEPPAPWHAERTRLVELASALGEVAGAAGKAALDVVLLSQTEIAEVREASGGMAGRGGSSTLPQKGNPVAAVMARGCAARCPGLVATLLAGMPQELQRAAGFWQIEAQAMSELLIATGSAVAWLQDSLDRLEVDADRMRANLDASGGLALAERVATALAPAIGRLPAHELVRKAAQQAAASGRAFGDVLAATPEVAAHLDREAIGRLLDPAGYLGSAGVFVDRVLAASVLAGGSRQVP